MNNGLFYKTVLQRGLIVTAKIPYLTSRKNVFYFRLGVPAELREIFKSREITQSLRTQNSDEAERKELKLADKKPATRLVLFYA
ncbi:DUF6538 domain-containing protein [Methylomonas sp.]|uniref:DUF6538 domain-containing protein n=1 Tax=Methylomonas sp. TaxID=418 RepID=UPI00341D3E51